ncbi:MAG: helix-turn-helix transcriptional regulator [Rhodobacter sp.]|uniref:helix-turn-helix transcriptional regulator n=1 Tax=Pararhodobacter sp. TaxID=2127056 RepID=UPI001D5AEF59|nr:helix-turn-helix transcriptional regulator [Pararhodobacter sp.]MCB1345574.1 helix-turn-helix transcriptional regulator [Paracoccaceae bacterium]MCC0072637.1 helix-turn-helix transcriptional regulator [Rhodobacter sp.]HPD93595.1 helix-turn-helix transcriptional regulator [Pararhodobacter sp.]
MHLTHDEADLVFAIMRELSGEFAHDEVRTRVGRLLLDLLDADFFASYVWDDDQAKFVAGVSLNMNPENLARYEAYYQFHDPITHTLQRRRAATPVSAVMAHDRLRRTEFFNDFLFRDGLYFGMNYFAWDRGANIGDLRIWRAQGKEDFSQRDAFLVDAIGPSLVNALIRANRLTQGGAAMRFAQRPDLWGLTQREAEVADMLVTGLSDDNICARLCISKPTLRTHVGSVFRKTGAQRRGQLVTILTQPG